MRSKKQQQTFHCNFGDLASGSVLAKLEVAGRAVSRPFLASGLAATFIYSRGSLGALKPHLVLT